MTTVAVAMAGYLLSLPGEALDLLLIAAGGEEARALPLLIQTPGAVVILLGVLSAAVAFTMWMHRAFRNLPALGARDLRWSPAWAAGAWFIPIVNFVVPILVASELWRASGGAGGGVRWLPAAWWAAWVTGSILNGLSGSLEGEAQSVQMASDALGVVGDVAMLAAGSLAIAFVHLVTRRQQALAEAQQAA